MSKTLFRTFSWSHCRCRNRSRVSADMNMFPNRSQKKVCIFGLKSSDLYLVNYKIELLYGSGGEPVTEVEGIPDLRNILSNLDDIPENLVQCEQVFDDYFRDGCGCNRKCHEKFPKFMAFEAHLDALDADQYCPDHINHQHLLLLGAMNALVQNHPTTIAKGLSTIAIILSLIIRSILRT